MPETAELNEKLQASIDHAGQQHLIDALDHLSDDQRQDLINELESVDFEALPSLIEQYVTGYQSPEIPTNLEPAPYYPATPGANGRDWNPTTYKTKGEQLIRDGKLAVFTVAGGQGTRLGYDGPKGCFPTSCVTNKPLFQLFAEQILASNQRYKTIIPWYIMTSPLNHDATEAFLKEHDYFGLPTDSVMLFQQGTMPSLDKDTGRLLLADNQSLATNPDGHGGAIKALVRSGATADMNTRGVEHIAYIQVDNPHVRCVDPIFLGLHAFAPDSSAEFSSKMIPKASWDEKVGVFCAVDGRVQVIEYSDLPEDLAKSTSPHGALRFNAGSIAIHAISVAFVEKLESDPSFALPYHRAIKKVPHFDLESGANREPTEPNAVKLERFVFDAIPLAEQSIVYETDRLEEFAPVKNREGTDSIVSSKELQTERAARWLEAAGVSIPRNADGSVNATIEISPLTACSAGQLAEHDDLPESIEPGSTVTLER